jgi:uncharacterized protein YhbP (UPF0306 family)
LFSVQPDIKIVKFIKKHHVFTLATAYDNQSWCCNCFYALVKDDMALVFTSDKETRHASEMLKTSVVSGSVVLETMIIGKIQGIQFTGRVELAVDDVLAKVKKAYLLRFPFAALADTTLWILTIDYIKMTDNTFGFGKKLIWERQ